MTMHIGQRVYGVERDGTLVQTLIKQVMPNRALNNPSKPLSYPSISKVDDLLLLSGGAVYYADTFDGAYEYAVKLLDSIAQNSDSLNQRARAKEKIKDLLQTKTDIEKNFAEQTHFAIGYGRSSLNSADEQNLFDLSRIPSSITPVGSKLYAVLHSGVRCSWSDIEHVQAIPMYSIIEVVVESAELSQWYGIEYMYSSPYHLRGQDLYESLEDALSALKEIFETQMPGIFEKSKARIFSYEEVQSAHKKASDQIQSRYEHLHKTVRS